LCEDVVHRFACLSVASSKYPEETEDLDLEEGIGDTGHVVLWAVSRCNQGFEMSDKYRDGLS